MHKPDSSRSGDHESVDMSNAYLAGRNVSMQHDVDTMHRTASSIA